MGPNVVLKPGDHNVAADGEAARARLDGGAHRTVAYHQRPCRDAARSEESDRFHQLQVVLLRTQQRGDPDYEVLVGETERGAKSPALLGAPRVAEFLGVDAVVDDHVSPREDSFAQPVLPLLFADENRAVARP